MSWTIWYEEDKVHGTTAEEWQQAPSEGVVAVYELFDNSKGYNIGRISNGSDWYWMTPDGEVGHSGTSSDIPDEWLELDAPDSALLKKGKWVTNERLAEVDAELWELISNGA